MFINKNIFFVMLFTFFSVFLFTSNSFAHKVMVFGWVEGDMVHTISKFNGGKKVKDAPVSVFDTEGTLLLKGNTDARGEFSFKKPEKNELKVVLEASMGHKTSCLIEVKSEDEHSTNVYDVDSREQRVGKQAYNEKNLESIIEKALDKKMALILRMIAEKESKQTISEIISGIGYILGLIGVALWVKNR